MEVSRACVTSRSTDTSSMASSVNHVSASAICLATSLYLQLQKLDLQGNPLSRG